MAADVGDVDVALGESAVDVAAEDLEADECVGELSADELSSVGGELGHGLLEHASPGDGECGVVIAAIIFMTGKRKLNTILNSRNST